MQKGTNILLLDDYDYRVQMGYINIPIDRTIA